MEQNKLFQHPEYARFDIRESTFNLGWPDVLPKSRHELLANGFFYTGRADWIVCFSCGIGLRNLEQEDNVYLFHSSLSPKCHFLDHKDPISVASTSTPIPPNKTFVPKSRHFLSHFSPSIQMELRSNMNLLRTKFHDMLAKAKSCAQKSEATANCLSDKLASTQLQLSQAKMELHSTQTQLGNLHKDLIQTTIQLRDTTRNKHELMAEVTQLRNKFECSICMSKTISQVTHCRHVFCNDCVASMDSCHICRNTDPQAQPLYLI